MTAQKLTEVFNFYQGWIGKNLACSPREEPDHPIYDSHLAYMCKVAAEELIPAGRTEKAFRWLGFVQGVLVARDLFTLEDVKNHSRPDRETPKVV